MLTTKEHATVKDRDVDSRLGSVNSLMAKTLRANGLGLTQNEVDDWLGVSHNSYSRWEIGIRRFPEEQSKKLEDLVGTRDQWADAMMESAMRSVREQANVHQSGKWVGYPLAPVELRTYATDEAFWVAHPEFQGIPAGVHRSAAALAWSRLRAAGVSSVIVDATSTEV